jgi:hypothetical protein
MHSHRCPALNFLPSPISYWDQLVRGTDLSEAATLLSLPLKIRINLGEAAVKRHSHPCPVTGDKPRHGEGYTSPKRSRPCSEDRQNSYWRPWRRSHVVHHISETGGGYAGPFWSRLGCGRDHGPGRSRRLRRKQAGPGVCQRKVRSIRDGRLAGRPASRLGPSQHRLQRVLTIKGCQRPANSQRDRSAAHAAIAVGIVGGCSRGQDAWCRCPPVICGGGIGVVFSSVLTVV